MIFYFYGKDNFLTKLEADKKIRELQIQGFKKVVLEDINDLKEITKSGSLFSEKKCFVFITEKLKEADKKSFKEIIFPDSGDIFIFVEKSATPSLLFGRTRVEKIKTGELDEKWLKSQAKEFNVSAKSGSLPAGRQALLGGEISKDLIYYFLNLKKDGYDAGYFYFELLKLSLFKPGNKLGLKDYLEVSQSKEELNYFEWIKAVLEKNIAKALKHVPENEYEALGRLKSLINIFELVLVSEGEVSPADKEKFLSKNSPFWVKNTRQWSSKMSYQEKQEKLEQLLDFEIGVKTGKIGANEALKLFVIG